MNTRTSSMSGNSKPSVSDTQYLHCLRNKVINMLRPKVVLSFLSLFHIFSFLHTRARRGSGSGNPPSAIISCDFHQQRHQSLLCVSSLLSFSRPSLVLSVLQCLSPSSLSWLTVDFSNSLKWQTRQAREEGRGAGMNLSSIRTIPLLHGPKLCFFFFFSKGGVGGWLLLWREF